jgi:hypothetical protein
MQCDLVDAEMLSAPGSSRPRSGQLLSVRDFPKAAIRQVSARDATGLLLGGAIDLFALRAQHHDAGFTRLVHANADARTTLWVGNQQLGLLVLIGELDA